MKILSNYVLSAVLALVPLFCFSQEYIEGDSPIIDSTWFLKPQFVVHYNEQIITFTKIDSIVYNQSQVQDNSSTFDKSFIKKRQDSLVILMKPKKLAFVDDSTKDAKHFGLCEYGGYLTNLKIHLVKVLGWENVVYFAIHDDGKMDTLWCAGLTPTVSNNKIVCYQYHGKYFQVYVDTFNTDQNKFKEAWDYTFIPQELYAFKWVDENDFFAVIGEHHKKKYYYKVSFTNE